MDNLLRSKIPYKDPGTENLIEFIRNGLRKNAAHTLLIDSKTERSWTGHELELVVLRIAEFLTQEMGFKKGDVCSLYGEDKDEISILILSIVCTGATCNVLTNNFSVRELHDTAVVLKSKYLITQKLYLEKLKKDFPDKLLDQLHVVSTDESCDGYKNSCKTIKDLLSKSCTKQAQLTFDTMIGSAKIDPDKDIAIIQFSSGTTGRPKPIPRTHKNLCHMVASVDHKELMNLKPGAVICGVLAITHRPGLWALLASVNGGSAYVVWYNTDVDEALSTISKYKVTIFSSSLPFLSALGNKGVQIKDSYDLSSWKHIITSGAKIVNPDLPRLLMEKFQLKSLRQCFGMTESGWVFLIEKKLARGNYLTVGHVCPGMEAIVINRDTGERLSKYERGEIALRGPQIFPGYLMDEPGKYNRSDFTVDGWFKIGDQAYFDKDELVFIEGRYKEKMTFENDCKYFPSEIEAMISEHPAIENVCVVKTEMKEDYAYDVARACVILKTGFSVDPEELLEFVKDRSPDVVLSGGVKILDKFPRLQNGKVDKQTLKNL